MKRGVYLIGFIIVLIMVSFVSAGFFDWFKKTGEVTEGPVDFNISVGAGSTPSITTVENWSGALTLNDGPSNTNISINFTVNDADGATNLVDGSAWVNLTNSGAGRANTTDCAEVATSGNYANYTCNITLWWWDSDGTWTFETNITDQQDNGAVNTSTVLTINTVYGFVSGPGNITFTTLNPGTTNQTPSNWLTLNNTGNQNIGYYNISINATNLTGEETSSLGLWAGNFSVGNLTGASNPECDSGNSTAQNMSASSFSTIFGALSNAGNYSINNNVTGQETLFVCIRTVGLELTQQAYSTFNEGAWTIKTTE